MDFIRKILRNIASRYGNEQRTIGKRILFIVLGVAMMTLVVGAVAIYSRNTIDSNTNEMVDVNIPEWNIANSIENGMWESGYNLSRYNYTHKDTLYKKAIAKLDSVDEKIEEGKRITEVYDIPNFERIIVQIDEFFLAYKASVDSSYKAIEELDQYRSNTALATGEFVDIMNEYTAVTNQSIQTLTDAGETRTFRKSLLRLLLASRK